MRILLIFLLGINPVQAAEQISTTGSVASPVESRSAPFPPKELSRCEARTGSAGSEEAMARQAAEKADLSHSEVLARLIYSEALSTGYWTGRCRAKSGEDVMRVIGWGVMNRIAKKGSLNPTLDVVFAPQQFRTSFSSKRHNPFAKAFLCPLKVDLRSAKAGFKAEAVFQDAERIADEILAEREAKGIPSKYQGITNFFYPHSEFFGEMRPSWAKNPVASKNRGYLNLLGVERDPCVEAYRL